MAKNTEIAAQDWLYVRSRVADKLKDGSPRSERDTRVRMAEALIQAGYVDVEFIQQERADARAPREVLTAGATAHAEAYPPEEHQNEENE